MPKDNVLLSDIVRYEEDNIIFAIDELLENARVINSSNEFQLER